MTIASSNFTILGYGEYSGATAPTTLTELPMTGESLSFQNQFISSQNINSSRQILDSIQTGYEVSGGIQIELAPKIYDLLMEGALWADWSTSIEVDNEDIEIDNTGYATATEASRTITTLTTAIFATTESDTTKIREGQFFQLRANAAAGIPAVLEGIYQVEEVVDGNTAIVYAVDEASPFKDSTTTTTADRADIRASMIRAPKDGTAANMVRHRYGFEKRQSDLSPELFTYFTNMYVNNFSVNAQSASLLTGSFDFMGSTSGMVETNSYFTSGSTAYTSAGSFNGFNAVSHVGDVILRPSDTGIGRNLNGLVSPAYMQGLDFSVANNLRGAKAIGNLGYVDILAGQLAVSGNLNIFFESKDMYDLFTGNKEFALSYSVLNGNNEGYVFSFPRATVNTDSMSSGGNDQDLVESMQWSSMYDSNDKGGSYSTGATPGYKTSIQIDRFYTTYS